MVGAQTGKADAVVLGALDETPAFLLPPPPPSWNLLMKNIMHYSE
jgi:hypothetical protein